MFYNCPSSPEWTSNNVPPTFQQCSFTITAVLLESSCNVPLTSQDQTAQSSENFLFFFKPRVPSQSLQVSQVRSKSGHLILIYGSSGTMLEYCGNVSETFTEYWRTIAGTFQEWFRTITGTLSEYCRNVAGMLEEQFWNIAGLLKLNIERRLLEHCRNIPVTFLQCQRNSAIMLEELCRSNFAGTLLECLMNITATMQEYWRNIAKTLQKLCRDVAGMLVENCRNTAGTFQGCW